MILVTGGTGLVGSHLLFSLVQTENKIRALVRSNHSIRKVEKVFKYYCSTPQKYLNKIEWIVGDVSKLKEIEKCFKETEYVYHCAAVISFEKKDLKYMQQVNVLGTSNIVDCCLRFSVKKLIHVSSIAAIGAPEKGHTYTESLGFPQGKVSGYSQTKSESEQEVWRGISKGLNAVIVNPSVILGPGHWNSGSGKLFLQVYKGVKFYTRGVTGFIDVRDVVEILILLMQSNIHSERYILNTKDYSYEFIFKQIAKALNMAAPKYFAPRMLTSIAWRVERVFSILSGRRPTLTRYSAKAAHVIQYYSSEKLQQRITFNFIPIEESIEYCSKLLLNEESEKFK